MKNLVILALTMFLGAFAIAENGSKNGIKVEIDKSGFQSEKPLDFKKGEPVVLDITRTTEKTCMKKLKHPKTGKLIDLPLNKQTRLDLGTYSEAKEITLLCGMEMTAGVVHVK